MRCVRFHVARLTAARRSCHHDDCTPPAGAIIMFVPRPYSFKGSDLSLIIFGKDGLVKVE
jgi:hypothetical protein